MMMVSLVSGHHGGHVKKGIGGVDNPEDSIGPNRVLDSVHQKDKTTLQQVVQDDKAEKGHFWHFFSTNPPLCINQLGKTSYKNKCFLSGIARITSPPLPFFRATCTSFSAVIKEYIKCIF